MKTGIYFMKLQTHIPLEEQEHNQLDYHSKIMMLGSCFVEHIGEKLEYFKFQNSRNPFGILFHPLAIESFITNVVNEKVYAHSDLFFHNEQWQTYEAHSKLSNTSKDNVLETLNTQIRKTHRSLKDASHLIITLGTSWVYRHIETDVIVANCHKVPQKQFLKELLSVSDIIESVEGFLSVLKTINPKLSVIFTVSPVRHLKDGCIENQQSKSHLITAIHQIIDPRKQVYYFPSYELMMDELRDYRFYAEDMIHPNTTAINYIWEKFQDVWISNLAKPTMKEVDTLQKGLLHKPFNPSSKAYALFVSQLKSQKEQLCERFTHMAF